MARIISQELDPNDKLNNLLAGDNVDSKKKQQDGTIEEAKRDAILEQAFDDVIKNQEFQNKAAAIYKTEGGRKFDKTGPGSLDALFDEYLFETPLYKNLETEKKTELDLLVLSTGLELSVLVTNIKNDLGNIDLDNSDRAVFNAIQEIANKKAANTSKPSLPHNGLNNTGGVGSGIGNGSNGNNSLPHNGITGPKSAADGTSDAKNDYVGNGVDLDKVWMDDMYKEGYEYKADIYDEAGYDNVSKNIENIYSNAKTRKVLERIFDGADDEQEIKRGTFRINLTLQDGLPSIILYLADMMDKKQNPSVKIKDETIKLDDLYVKNSNKEVTGFSGFDVKKVKAFFKNYDPKGAKFDDYKKIAKILNNSSRQDLYTFATLLQSRSDLSTTVKQWNNSLELTGNSRDDKTRTPEGEDKKSLITAGKIDKNGEYKDSNVLQYLCDFNSDNALSGAPVNLDNRKKQKNRKEQKNQGDVGGIFGQQLNFTIEQAIKVADATLLATPADEPYKGENVVIQNILENIAIGDRRKWPKLDNKIEALIKDPSKCTLPKLAELVNEHAEFKQLFRDAIEKINGGPDALSPDLLETLTGMDDTELLDTISKERELKDEIDKAIKNNPKLKLIIDKQGLVYVRNTIFTSIMSVLDHLQITTTDNGNNTNIRDYGIQKGFELNRVKNMLLQNVINNLVTMGLSGDPTNIRLMLGFAKYGQTPDGKVKYGFDVSAGPNIDITNGEISLLLTIGADVAFQYNYKKVINANLDAVKSAKYIGIEARAMAGFDLKALGVVAEASAGVEWLQDPVTGINQINKQYTDLSSAIFDAKEATTLNSVEDLRSYLDRRITSFSSSGTFKDFLANNLSQFNANKDFILEYIEKNNIMTALQGKDIEDQKTAINSLFDVLQGGNIEQRRHDLIANLHGKVDLTKLSFGVSTSMFSRGNRQSNDVEGGNQYTGDANTGTSNVGTGDRNANKLSIAGFYVSARISTWRNHYVPQEKQWLMTQAEITTGKGNKIDFASAGLDVYAKYIEAMYNSPNIKVTTQNDKLVIKSSGDIDIWKYLNIHAKTDDPESTADDAIKHNYMIKSNSVIIGNVGDLGVYTVAEGDGVRRFLVIGSKGTQGTELVKDAYSPKKETKDDEGKVISTQTGESAIDPISKKTETYRPMKQQEITDIATQANGLPENVQKIITGAVDVNGVLTDSKGNKVNVTSGTVTVIEKSDGKFEISYLPGDKTNTSVVIEYKKEMPGGAKDETTVSETFDTKLLVYKNDGDLDNVIRNYLNNDAFRKTIMEAENTNEGAYKNFLSTVDTDLLGAKEQLKKILSKYENKEPTKSFVSLIDKLATAGDADSLEALAVALDGVKTILALEYKYDGQSIATLLKARKETFAGLKGPSGDVLPTELQSLRDGWEKDTKAFGKITKKLVPNIIGYTAFYRYEKTGDHRRFSLTAPGSTRILDGYQKDVPADKTKVARDWLLKNLESNNREFNLVRKSLESYLVGKYPNIKLTKQDVINLITNKKAELTIDNKKINVTLNSKMVFYLLGECGNESLGLQIESLSVVESKKYDDAAYKKVSGDAKMQTGYVMNVSAEGHSVPMKVQTEEMRIGYTHHQSLPKGKEGSNQYIDDEDSNQHVDGDGEGSGGNQGGGDAGAEGGG